MAVECCQNYNRLSQRYDILSQKYDRLSQSMDKVLIEVVDLKQMISEGVGTGSGLRPKVHGTLTVDGKSPEFISEEHSVYPNRPQVLDTLTVESEAPPESSSEEHSGCPNASSSYATMSSHPSIYGRYYPPPESSSEEHSGYEEAPDSSYVTMSSHESIYGLFYPPDLHPKPSPEPKPKPELVTPVASPSKCFSHPEPGSTPGRFWRRESESVDAKSVQSLDSKNCCSVNKNDMRGVHSKIAPSIVAVCSFLDKIKVIDCSGLIVDWNSVENEATVLTSAKLLWSPENFGCEVELIVRLGDGTLLLATEDYVDFYHNFITVKVKSAVELEAVDLTSRQAEVVEGMNVSALGRSFYVFSLFDFGGELHVEDPLFGCAELLRSTCKLSAICDGGPLITDAGYVVGMNLFGNCVCAHLLRTPIILTCLEMWRSSRNVVRPLLGMSVVDVDRVPYEIWKRFKISYKKSYVAVKEVYEGSLADLNDVRSGDLIVSCNGIPIESAKQYYKLMSETSRAATACGYSGQRSLTVVINPFDGRSDRMSIEADNVSVDDTRFYNCWPQIKDDGVSLLELKLFKWRLMSDRKLKKRKRSR